MLNWKLLLYDNGCVDVFSFVRSEYWRIYHEYQVSDLLDHGSEFDLEGVCCFLGGHGAMGNDTIRNELNERYHRASSTAYCDRRCYIYFGIF